MLTKEELPACPVATTVALIGSKWKLLIMRNLQMRTWRFNELKKDLDGISQKVLTDSPARRYLPTACAQWKRTALLCARFMRKCLRAWNIH